MKLVKNTTAVVFLILAVQDLHVHHDDAPPPPPSSFLPPLSRGGRWRILPGHRTPPPPCTKVVDLARGRVSALPKAVDARRSSPLGNSKVTHQPDLARCPCTPLADSKLHQDPERSRRQCRAVHQSALTHTPTPKRGCDGY